jgi:hypothetical protein
MERVARSGMEASVLAGRLKPLERGSFTNSTLAHMLNRTQPRFQSGFTSTGCRVSSRESSPAHSTHTGETLNCMSFLNWGTARFGS